MIPKLTKTKPAAVEQDLPVQEQPGLEQRLLAEAVRLHEDAQGFAIHDSQADTIARGAAGNFERRIIVRAQALPIAPALKRRCTSCAAPLD